MFKKLRLLKRIPAHTRKYYADAEEFKKSMNNPKKEVEEGSEKLKEKGPGGQKKAVKASGGRRHV